METAIDIRKYDFPLKRLHSLIGLLVLSVFFIEHMVMNSLALAGIIPGMGIKYYNFAAGILVSLPALIAVEMAIIFLPLAFHGIYGLWIIWTAGFNATSYNNVRNWSYVLQRVTGIIILLFLFVHIWYFRITPSEEMKADIFNMVAERMKNPWWFIFHAVGYLSATIHFANGICTALMTWGITRGRVSQKWVMIIMGIVAAVIAVALMSALIAFKMAPSHAVG